MKFAAHLVISALWMAITGFWSAGGLSLGLLIGAGLLSLLPGTGLRYGVRLIRITRLLLLFLGEFAQSVVRVFVLVLRPRLTLRPRFFTFPLTVTSDLEITLLANMITLTPGTLTVDVAADRRTLLVHAVDCPDADAARRDIADGFERRIKEAFAP
jgi:multicomponent Na+:H+ antiporter subunit E